MRIEKSIVEYIVYGLVFIFIPVFLIFFSVNDMKVDEVVHILQIQNYSNGDFKHVPALTTFTFYHHVIAGMSFILHLTETYEYRNVTLFFSVLLILLFLLNLRALNSPNVLVKFLQTAFLPIIFPFYYLVYTDLFSLLFVLISLYYFNKERYVASLLFVSVALLIRQTNLIWLVFFPTILFFENFIFSKQNILLKISKLYGWIIVCLSFFAFVIYNKGVAVGDNDQHSISFNLTNFYFLIIVLFILFLPIFLSNYKKVWGMIQKNKWIIILVLILFPYYMYSFKVEHKYNLILVNYFLRNKMLYFIDNLLWVKVLSYLIFCYTIIAISSIQLIQKKWNWIYVFAPLSIIPLPLIEQRYYIIAITIWQLVRKPVSSTFEWLNFCWCFILSICLYLGIMSGQFFL